ncbi:MAG: T9SS type A sorting domain-containing protein [Ignavibacteria bacterium]|jgi:hypothetical protein
MKKLSTLGSVLLLFLVGATTFAQTDVTFSVDMNIWQAKDQFDPENDTVWVAGGFNEWNSRGNMLTETGTDNVYEVTLSLDDGEYFFKFTFTNGSVKWEDNVGNRSVTPAGSPITAGTYFFDEERGTYSGVAATVEFNVDMRLPIMQGNVTPGTTNIYVAGNFSSWQDGAALMDDSDSDSVYTVSIDTLTSGTVLYYKFIYSSSDAASGSWEQFTEGDDIGSGGNRIYGIVDDDPGLTRFWENTDPNVELADGSINFGVDMQVMTEAGIYNPVADSLWVRGGFNGWGNDFNAYPEDEIKMNQEILNPNKWTLPIAFNQVEVGSDQLFKFYVNKIDTGEVKLWTDGYERPLNVGGGNRAVAFEGIEGQEVVYYYDNVHPDWVIEEGTTLEVTFSVDMSSAVIAGEEEISFNADEDPVYWLPEEPAFARVMGWVDSDTMRVLELTDPDDDMIYTGTLTVEGPAWNAFEYRYCFYNVSEGEFKQETSGYGDYSYRVRYAAMTGTRQFVSPYDMPQDSWLDEEDKSSQWEEQPEGWVTSVNVTDGLPNQFELSQNYPNPFNPSTLIKFSIPKAGNVTLKVYNMLGQEIKTLVNREMKVGTYEVNFNASNLASGIYFYSIKAGTFISTKKMMLLK